MLRLVSPIKVYIKFTLERTENGKRQVMSSRQAGLVLDFDYDGAQGFGVHRWVETVNGPSSAIITEG